VAHRAVYIYFVILIDTVEKRPLLYQAYEWAVYIDLQACDVHLRNSPYDVPSYFADVRHGEPTVV